MKKVFGMMLAGLLGLTLIAGALKCTEAEAAKKNAEVTIYLIRHGKTFFNTTGQVQGFADSPLTDKGISQAKKLGTGLKEITFDLVYYSDLGRQRNTAKLILSKNDNKKPKLLEHDGFKEWNYGGYEGKTDKEMWTPIFEANGFKLDDEWSDYEKLVEKIGDDGIANAIAENDSLGAAENYDEITTRGKAAMAKVIKDAKKSNAKNVMVVSSGGMIPTLLEMLVPDEYNGEMLDNCSVTTLKYKDGNYTLDKIGDTQYIQ